MVGASAEFNLTHAMAIVEPVTNSIAFKPIFTFKILIILPILLNRLLNFLKPCLIFIQGPQRLSAHFEMALTGRKKVAMSKPGIYLL